MIRRICGSGDGLTEVECPAPATRRHGALASLRGSRRVHVPLVELRKVAPDYAEGAWGAAPVALRRSARLGARRGPDTPECRRSSRQSQSFVILLSGMVNGAPHGRGHRSERADPAEIGRFCS